MLSYLQYLFALVIASSGLAPPDVPAPAPDVAGILLTIVAFGLAWTTIGALVARRLRSAGDDAVPVYLRTMALGRVAVLGVFWFLAQTLQAKEIAHTLGVAHWVLVPHLLRFLPFAALLALLRGGLHRAGARLRLEPPGLLATLSLEFRQALLPLGPLLPLLVVWDVVFLADPASWLGAVRDVFVALPVAQAALSLGVFLLAMLAMPFLLRRAWHAEPLPAGPLRTRLEAYAESVGLRAREMLVWPTGGAQMNAAVVGALPRFRYVFLTDGLIETLGPDEIEAVFAHEAGHARRGHVLLFFGFTAVLVLSSLLPDALGASFAGPLADLDPLVRSIAMVLIWIGVVFGWVSRRFEQEADVFGIDTVPFPPAADGTPRDPSEHPFARALERIAAETGGIREITGWRHFSIADRVEFVRAYLTDAGVRARYRRSIRLLRGTLITLIGGFALLAALRVPGELAAAPVIWRTARDPAAKLLEPLRRATTPAPATARARAFFEAARLAQRAGEPERALRWLRSAAALSPGDAYVLAAYAQALGEAERPRGAAIVWRDLLALPDAPELLRERAEAALAGASAAAD